MFLQLGLKDSPACSSTGTSESSRCSCLEFEESIQDCDSFQTQTTSDSLEKQCSCCSCTGDCVCEAEQSKENDVTRELKTGLKRFILLDKFPVKEVQRIEVIKVMFSLLRFRFLNLVS